jgi:FKBP-type peptidyl-prolyl cis-trans isomerase SlyD
MEDTHKVLFINYEIRNDQDELVDSNEPDQPIELHLGLGMMLEAFEEAIKDLQENEEKRFELTPDQAYGEYNPELLHQFPRKDFPQEMELEVGMPLAVSDEHGNEAHFIVAEIGDDVVVCDFNHPMAGETMRCYVKVVKVEEHDASECNVHFHDDDCGHGGCCGNCSC